MSKPYITRYDQFDQWYHKHKEKIIVGSCIAAGLVLFTLVVKADLDSQKVALNQLSTNINELNAWHAAEQMIEQVAA